MQPLRNSITIIHQLRRSTVERRILFAAPVFFVILLPLPVSLFSQNLISNPSFESGTHQCDYTVNPYTFDNYVWGWSCPTNGTTDIFSTAIPNKSCLASMPANNIPTPYPDLPRVGDQLPRSGSRFIGIFSFNKGTDHYHAEPIDSVYREYAQTELLEPLVIGEYYCAEMYVSLAEQPRYAANNLGMYFHENKIDQRQYWIPVDPQVVEREILLNTNYWMKIAGAFRADTPARYVTVGNFSGYDDTKFVDKGGTHPNSSSYDYAYYFIDDVSVTKLQAQEFVYSGASTICEGEAAHITISGGLENIAWSTLADTAVILGRGINFSALPSSTTSYLIRGSNCGLTVTDTLTIHVKPGTPVNFGPDQTICSGTSLKLDAGGGYQKYLWQDGSTGRFHNVTEAGDYRVMVENEYGCRYTDEIRVSVTPIPKIDLGKDTLVCGSFFTIQPEFPLEFEYQWSTGTTNPEYTPTSSGTYFATARNECGEASDTINIVSNEDIFIPNVITLNNDNLNDAFVILGTNANPELSIYNRWGTEIFHTNKYENDWPFRSDAIHAGIYYYYLTYPGCKSFLGSVQVIQH